MIITETIEWHYLPELPDEDVTCLLAIDDDSTDEVIVGFLQEGQWMQDCGEWDGPMQVSYNVYAWAHAPAKPPRKP